MPSRTRSLLALVVLGLLLTGGLLGRLACRQPEVLDSPEVLLRHLQAAGLDYEGHQVEPQLEPTDRYSYPGLHLKRCGDPRSWEELTSLVSPRHSPRHVVVRQAVPTPSPGTGITRL